MEKNANAKTQNRIPNLRGCRLFCGGLEDYRTKDIRLSTTYLTGASPWEHDGLTDPWTAH